jgi:hypothetical protein
MKILSATLLAILILRVRGTGQPPFSSPPPTVISNGAGRRFFLRIRSCECVGLRREKSLFSLRHFKRVRE